RPTPPSPPRPTARCPGIILLQEAFGVNHHIRSVPKPSRYPSATAPRCRPTPPSPPRPTARCPGIILLQEAFGVNHHIRSV
ncbi:hypothetical protein, partial [Hymenobacter coccineus]|uniref:hypothetical protein n=1 Tax=Hymenobacter coccineus TaxID=1908235 RepID=UPI001955B793